MNEPLGRAGEAGEDRYGTSADRAGSRGGRRASRRRARGSFHTRAVLAASVLVAGACGGDGPTQPPPPPVPPPPPPPPPPAVNLSLNPGEMQILQEAAQVRAFQLNGTSETPVYVVAVSSGSQTNASTSIRMRVTPAGGASGSVSGTGPVARPAFQVAAPDLERLAASSAAELRFREAERRAIDRLGAAPVPAGRRLSPGGQLSVSRALTVPQVGDTLRFKMAVQDLNTVNCEDTSIRVVGVVRAVGSRFALVEDTATRAGVPANFYPDLIPELDGQVFPVDSAYFGETADIDGNERVLVLFTAEVNKLTPPGSSGAIGGFFFSGDLIDPSLPTSQGGCPASNEAELLYLRAPDPDGRFGPPVDLSAAERNARSVVSHEFNHLITAEQRFILGGGLSPMLEETWLNEGLAHIAEEVSGHMVLGLGPGQNLVLGDVVTSEETFEAAVSFQLQNFLRLDEFFGSPETTQTLATMNPPLGESLKMRGWAWVLLRWLADRFAAGGPGILPGSATEQTFFRELTRGGPGNNLTGIQNLLNALGSVGASATWEDLVAEFASMPGLDDAAPPGAPAVTQLASWDLRGTFRDLHEETTFDFSPPGPGGSPVEEEYPLSLRPVALSSSTDETITFSLRGGAQKYFLFQGTAPPDIVVELTSTSGGDLPAGARVQVTIVRQQ